LEALEADSRVWVAGSAAIIPEKADDIDIWTLKKSSLKPEAFNMDLWEEPLAPDGYSPMVLEGVTKRLQTTVPAIDGYTEAIKLQVMFTQHKTVFDLLETFDVSCHAWARNKAGFLVAHSKATLPGSPIVSLLPSSGCDDPECSCNEHHKLTAQRIEEFSKRYADTPASLCWLPA
jgi:hypothetical protein